MIQAHHRGVDFEVEIENQAGDVIMYKAIPRWENLDPGFKVILAVQDHDNWPAPEDEIDESALEMLFETMLQKMFLILHNQKGS